MLITVCLRFRGVILGVVDDNWICNGAKGVGCGPFNGGSLILPTINSPVLSRSDFSTKISLFGESTFKRPTFTYPRFFYLFLFEFILIIMISLQKLVF
jgi:hypothetical protein